MFLHSVYFWFSLSLICLIIEILSLSFLFGAFAAAGAITALAAFFTHNHYILSVVFVAASLLIFVFLRPWYLSFVVKKSNIKRFGFNSLVGKVVLITQQISPIKAGYVKVDADRWKAHADQDLEVGTKVTIVKAEGNSVWVEPLAES